MNEMGLAFDSTSVPYTEPNLHGERAPFLVPEIFGCGTIGEVIEYKNTHGVYQQEGGVQSFYVDKTGESVVFSIGEDGEFQFHTDEGVTQLATNFYVEDPSRRNPGSDAIRRYDDAEQALDNLIANGGISVESIALVLDSVHFEGSAVNTLYSNVFDVTNGDVYLYFFHQFEEVVKFNLEEELAKGRHTYRISDLFTQETVDSAFNEYCEFPYIIRVIPIDLLLLFAAMILDAVLILASVFVVGRKLLRGNSESKDKVLDQNTGKGVASKGLLLQVIVSLPVVWSLLSFPMIYWNHRGEWWPFFDIPILNWPLQPFYAQHNVFLLASLLGVVSVSFLLSSFANRGEAIRLAKRGLELGKENRLRNAFVLGTPILIGVFCLILETLDVIHDVDWVMFAIMYPLMAAMLTILAPIAEKMDNPEQGPPRARSKMDLLRTGILLIFTWGLWFLPVLLTGKTDHMYALLLANLSLSVVVLAFYESSQGQPSAHYP